MQEEGTRARTAGSSKLSSDPRNGSSAPSATQADGWSLGPHALAPAAGDAQGSGSGGIRCSQGIAPVSAQLLPVPKHGNMGSPAMLHAAQASTTDASWPLPERMPLPSFDTRLLRLLHELPSARTAASERTHVHTCVRAGTAHNKVFPRPNGRCWSLLRQLSVSHSCAPEAASMPVFHVCLPCLSQSIRSQLPALLPISSALPACLAPLSLALTVLSMAQQCSAFSQQEPSLPSQPTPVHST